LMASSARAAKDISTGRSSHRKEHGSIIG